MASDERRKSLFGLFKRSRRDKTAHKVKGVTVPGQGRVTDALGASRAMRPVVVRPDGAEAEAAPGLTVVRPPVEAARRSADRHVEVQGGRLRFSLSYLAAGTLAVALALLLLVAFVMGMRYEEYRAGSGPSPANPGGEVVRGGASGGRSGVNLGINSGPPGPAPAAGPQYRLRIVAYRASDREAAEKNLDILKQHGIPAVLERRVLDGRDSLVIYSQQAFESKSSPEATALQQKVIMIKQGSRYEFASAYYVTVD